MSVDAAEIEPRSEPPAAPKVRLLTLDSLDGRTASARLVRDLVATFASDLGGEDHLTEGVRQLVQRAAVLGAMIEDNEARWITGDKFDVPEYLAAINAQRRVLATIGLERRTRDVTPDLRNYIASNPSGVAQDSAPEPAGPDDSATAPNLTHGLANGIAGAS